MDGGWFILSTFLFSTVLFGDKHPRPILLSASRASPVYSYGGYARGVFYTIIGWAEIGGITTIDSHYGLVGWVIQIMDLFV